MSDANALLMQFIRGKWGTAIDLACKTSSVPPAFLAALVANESGGVADAKRFEKNVLAALWEVLVGRKAAYGSIQRNDLLQYAVDQTHFACTDYTDPRDCWADGLFRLDGLATSEGLTQIMGYEVLDPKVATGVLRCAEDLRDPEKNLSGALTMLTQFAERNGLDLTMPNRAEASKFFDCWNTGRTNAPTADPNYIPNGLARMAEYNSSAPSPGDAAAVAS